jgi:hypothetical protein
MARNCRRNFLKAAGVAEASPAASTLPAAAQTSSTSKPYRRTSFSSDGNPRKISDNLYVFEDTCNLYVIRDGTRCVLIDFGSGKILDHLPQLGISNVDWILHTHPHRDQGQGVIRR